MTPDFKSELLPLHSPLLRQSLLVSFPPLIDMLKFSGYPYLIWGHPRRYWVGWGQVQSTPWKDGRIRFITSGSGATILPMNFWRVVLFQLLLQSHPSKKKAWGCGSWRSDRHALRNAIGRNVRSKIRWFTRFCNSHYLSHFTAFFIDARA